VRTELNLIANPEAKERIEQAFHDGWLQSQAVTNQRLAAALSGDLDGGEAEAIALAAETGADLLLMDER
jgi:predicted nucleic acid-binding protein